MARYKGKTPARVRAKRIRRGVVIQRYGIATRAGIDRRLKKALRKLAQKQGRASKKRK